MALETQLVRIMPNGEEWVMNRITFSSKFKSLPWVARANMNTPENQLRAARELKEGWEQAGPWPDARFEIRQNGEVVQ